MLAPTPPILIPEWMPDLSDIGTGTSRTITNVIPRGDGYGPFRDFAALTMALPAACRGYYFARNTDGSITVFAGTSTKLYKLNNTTFAWDDVSKGAGSYSPLISTDMWMFEQYNSVVLAVQINTVPQAFTLGSSTAFADLGGSPPQASHVAIINFFVVLTGLLSNPNRIQWSDLDGITTWTAGIGLSDYQDLPDGGNCHGISGGDAYGLVFQDQSIRSLIYAPGSAVVFQITRISTQDALYARYSIINAGDRTFFCSAQGFKMVLPGGVPIPIGKSRVDRFFFGDVDTNNLQLMIGATDPTGTRVYWAYKSTSGNVGLFDKILVFDWSIGKQGRWSLLTISGEYLAALAAPGLTLEQLDAIAPGALTVTGAANNGAGLIRLTLNATSSADFAIAGQNFIVVQGVVGTTEANGAWVVNIINSTHIDLVGSTFTNAYVSGGKIGGSLDALTFSLDSISTAAIAKLSCMSPDHKAGFFTGDNLEAILEADEQDGVGAVLFVEAVRPMTDSPDAVISLGSRMRPQDTVAYTDETAIGDDGVCPQLLEARYIKPRMRIPAGSVWTYARGFQPVADKAGDR